MKPYMLYWPSTRDSHCFPECVFAVIWLFPTRLPACPPIVEAFASPQLWYKSRKVFAAVSVVRIIRHIDQSTRHLVRDSASDCKYRTAGGVPCFVSLIAHECIPIFCPPKGHSIAPSMYNSHCTRMLGVERLHFLTNWTLEPTPVLSWRSSILFSTSEGTVVPEH